MKIIHTADIHLDRNYAALGLPSTHGNDIRSHLQSLLRRILLDAEQCGSGAVVITGDLFEHDRITRSTINFLRDAFAALDPVRVFICPGKHDRCIAGSPYLTEPWPANVHIFTSSEWQAVPIPDTSVTIHGIAWQDRGTDDLLPELANIPDDGRTHLAFAYGMADNILHGGAFETAHFEGAFLPHPSLAYLGLGEFHTTRAITGDFTVPVWYAGAPEGHAFDDPGPHHCLELSVSESGDVAITPRPVSEGLFHTIVLDGTPFCSGQELMEAVRAAWTPHHATQYVQLTLEGSLIHPIYDELDGIRDALAEDVRYLQWHDRCQLDEDYDIIAGEHTSLGAFVARINQEIADAPTHALRLQRSRCRDLGIAAYRDTALPVRGLTGDYR